MKNTMINSDAMIASITAFLDPFVISHDGEFEVVVGRSRSEQAKVFSTWPVGDHPSEEQLRLVSQTVAQLHGYPHKQDEYIEKTYGISREQISLLYFYWNGWRDGIDPTQTREWRKTPTELHLFGEFPSGGTRPCPRTPLFLRVDSDIADFFKEGTHKETYRRMHDVLRAYVDKQCG